MLYIFSHHFILLYFFFNFCIYIFIFLQNTLLIAQLVLMTCCGRFRAKRWILWRFWHLRQHMIFPAIMFFRPISCDSIFPLVIFSDDIWFFQRASSSSSYENIYIIKFPAMLFVFLFTFQHKYTFQETLTGNISLIGAGSQESNFNDPIFQLVANIWSQEI